VPEGDVYRCTASRPVHATRERLPAAGREVHTLRGAGHVVWLEDPNCTPDAVRDPLVGERTQHRRVCATQVRTPAGPMWLR
jgi:pimeloyl-ACP methyl ester carboxylesterase